MKYRVIISERAARDMASHLSFLANVSQPAAKDAKQRIVEAVRSLEQMPNRYPFFEDDLIPKNKYHKMYIENWYLVLYQIRDDTVYVEYILDCRQEYRWLK